MDNAAEAVIKGAELEVKAVPTDALSLNLIVTYTDAKYTDYVIRNPATGAIVEDRTNDPFITPEWSYSVGAQYRWDLPVGALTARLDWSHRESVDQLASIFGTLGVHVPAYGLLSGRLELAVAERDLSVAVVGRNLLDETYITNGIDLRSLGFNAAIPGERRYIGVQLTQRW